MRKNNNWRTARYIVIFWVITILFSACRPQPVSFVAVRAADYRVGPVELPLNDEGQEKILVYLLKGGVNSREAYAAGANPQDIKKNYDALFKLLADPDFLYSSKFRKADEIGKISASLENWFESSITYSVIDACRDRPTAIAPISVKDKNKKYWWIFYRPEKVAEGEEKDIKIVNVVVTLTPTEEDLKHYGKIK